MTGANSALPIWTDFMQAALTEHPEWQGDWTMPEGISQIEINPKTGEPAAPEDLEKRVELFLNGTHPGNADESTEETPAEETAPTPEGGVETQPSLEPSPSPSPKPSKPEVRPPDTTRLEGTITLDIDPTTGLIAVESCPVVRTKTFMLGSEPRKYCGPEYHKPRQNETRPRLVNP
jgi:hypothetical protein